MAKPLASVVITTRNRREDTLRALASCYAQDCHLEVLVYDDCSDDGTVEAVKKAFPQARVFASSKRTGYIVNRNLGFRQALAPVVFSIDDDAYFSERNIVSRTLEELHKESDIAAIAIPFVEPLARRSLSSLAAPALARPGDDLRSYIGCAHAVKRDLALKLGGYREFFIHQGEERDLCIRLQKAGYRIVYGSADYVVHMVNPKREAERISYYGTRNQIFFEALNVPFPQVLVRVPKVIVGILRYRFSFATLPVKLKAVLSGLFELPRRLKLRAPLSPKAYQHYLGLASHGAQDWQGEVPVPCHLKDSG